MGKVNRIYLIAAIAVIGKSTPHPRQARCLDSHDTDKTRLCLPGGALFGFDISSMSAIITTQPYLCTFNQRGFDDNGLCLGPTSTTQGGIVSAMPAGSFAGALVSGWASDRFGRKKSIMLGSLIWSAT